MTTILQISDTHIVPQGLLVSRGLDTADALGRLVKRITSILDRIEPVSSVLVSGDLSDDGQAESYALFKTLMAPLNLPLDVIPGNHDAREAMREAFADHLPASGPLNWARAVGAVRLIGLDTLVEGQGAGTLLSESLAFLEQALLDAGEMPVLLALHHPPFQSGIGFMDQIGLTNRETLRDVVTGHAGPLRMVCGHIHNMMVSDMGGHIAISCPSPCSTFSYDLRADAPVGFMAQEDGFLLHRWDTEFQTIRIGLEAGPGPFPF